MPDLVGLQTVVSTLQNLVVAVGNLSKQVAASTSAVFAQIQGTSATATAGAIASPGNFAGFIDVTLPNGTTVKVGYFDP